MLFLKYLNYNLYRQDKIEDEYYLQSDVTLNIQNNSKNIEKWEKRWTFSIEDDSFLLEQDELHSRDFSECCFNPKT